MSAPEDAALPITAVTLYTSGVGYFERSGEVEGDSSQTLMFPVGQINDVLKSLVLLDTGGGVARPVTYAAQDPVSKALQAFSVDVSDNPDRATLLNRMRGTEVTVRMQDEPAPLSGLVVGVEEQTAALPDGGGTTEHWTLNLLAGDALYSLPLPSIRSLQFNDSRLGEELRQALGIVARGRDANTRPLTLTFSGQGRRRVQVGYLAEAPAWQTTYRLVLGETPRLQGWALVQNTGQDDWDETHLTLVSGRPISFIQDLYTPLYVHRPTVQPRIAASPIPQTYAGSLMAADLAVDFSRTGPVATRGRSARSHDRAEMLEQAAMPQPEEWPASRLSPEQAVRRNVATTGAQLGAALFAYQIDVPVSVPRQQSAMIPFLAAQVQAERVAVYNPQVQRAHPLSGARIKNTSGLHLMGGPLTVFQTRSHAETGYVGDALLDDTEPGQTRLATYAVDLAVDAELRDRHGEATISSVKIVGGVLNYSRKHERIWIYTFKNNSSEPRTVVVEHADPGHDWKLVVPEAPTERTADVYRFDLAVPAGQAGSLEVRQAAFQITSVALLEDGLDTLLRWTNANEASQNLKAVLEDIIARRRALAEKEAKIDAIDAHREVIVKGQERIRQNMQALEYKSDLYKRYLSELDAQETKIGGLETEREQLQADLERARQELHDRAAHLDVA